MQACRSGFIYLMPPSTRKGRYRCRRAQCTAAPKPRCNHGMQYTVSLICPPKSFVTASAALVRIREVLGWHLTSRKLPCGNIVEEVEELSRIDCSTHAWRSCQSATTSLSDCEALVGGDYKRLLQVKADGRDTFCKRRNKICFPTRQNNLSFPTRPWTHS
jgi:hypothetical protein